MVDAATGANKSAATEDPGATAKPASVKHLRTLDLL